MYGPPFLSRCPVCAVTAIAMARSSVLMIQSISWSSAKVQLQAVGSICGAPAYVH